MLYPVIPSAAAGVFQRSVTPPDALVIATNPSGASCAASASADASGVGDSEIVADSVGVGAASSDELFRLETIKPRIKIPSKTKSVTRLEPFLAGAAGAALAEELVPAFGVVETIVGVDDLLGTGGITIFAEPNPRFADFLATFFADFLTDFLTDFFAAFLAGRFTAFLAEDFFADDFFAVRFAAFLAGDFFAAFFFAATIYSLN